MGRKIKGDVEDDVGSSLFHSLQSRICLRSSEKEASLEERAAVAKFTLTT